MTGGLVRAAHSQRKDIVIPEELDTVDDAVTAQAHEQVG